MSAFTNYHERKGSARGFRREQTEAEQRLWGRLRDRRLGGFKFRRQFPLGPFFADFCCLEERLVIEVDGGQHAAGIDQDRNRTYCLNDLGFKVIRFWNNEVLAQTDLVCEQILNEIRKEPHPNPLPQGEGVKNETLSRQGEGGKARVRR
jgi:very-short-patch-repair endonuclease